MNHSPLRICMISDFFFPNMGGVENHIYYLSQCLRKRGHEVIVVTHAYGSEYTGIKWLEDGLKVYYLPIPILYNQCTYPLFYLNFSYLYSIFKREGINYVHGHQAFSSLCHEGLFHARTMNIPCSFTDHSLFGFADVSSVLTNKLLKVFLSGVDNVICVSYTSKENTVLRAALPSNKVNVIPNAVLTSHFIPASKEQDKAQTDNGIITIVILCRLVYRKGIDLLRAVIPRVCKASDKVKFLIAGDGPKKIDLEQMRDEHLLHDKVQLIGSVPANEARNVLIKGQIFLNTSLTEAFCMAIAEAASCGLLVVSTKVGGIPEVLPSHMMLLCQPDATDLTENILKAIDLIENKKIDTSKFHSELSEMYSWDNVAERTEAVYYSALEQPKDGSLIARLADYYGCGEVVGKIACCMVIVDFILLVILQYCLTPMDLVINENEVEVEE